MTQTLKIDFVSDVVCPWCVVGLGGLEGALARVRADGIDAEITFRPFLLNPDMAPEGETIGAHIARKYGSTPEQSAASRQLIHDKAAEVGFTMNTGPDSRIWNTFDCHRLLHWAGETAPDKQGALKKALFETHFTGGRNLTDPEVLADGRYAEAVRAEAALWMSRGINSVPAVVIEGKYLISGGQPAAVFEEGLRKIAADLAGEEAAG